MKHRLVLTDEELDSIRASLGQVMAKGITSPDLVRLDYRLEKLRQAKSRIKKAEESIEKTSAKPQEDTKDTHVDHQKAIIRIVRR